MDLEKDMTMLDRFAISAMVPLDDRGFPCPHAVSSVMSDRAEFTLGMERLQYFAMAEARIRYIKAEAMMKARAEVMAKLGAP